MSMMACPKLDGSLLSHWGNCTDLNVPWVPYLECHCIQFCGLSIRAHDVCCLSEDYYFFPQFWLCLPGQAYIFLVGAAVIYV